MVFLQLSRVGSPKGNRYKSFVQQAKSASQAASATALQNMSMMAPAAEPPAPEDVALVLPAVVPAPLLPELGAPEVWLVPQLATRIPNAAPRAAKPTIRMRGPPWS